MSGKELNIHVGGDTLNVIYLTAESGVPFIKILSNVKYWYSAYCSIGILDVVTSAWQISHIFYVENTKYFV